MTDGSAPTRHAQPRPGYGRSVVLVPPRYRPEAVRDALGLANVR